MKSEEILKIVLKAIDDKHGEDVVAYDMQNISLLADYFVITSANSNRQIQAIVDAVVESLKKHQVEHLRVEGQRDSNWFLIDVGDVVVNVFSPESRDFYGLEKLWSEAKEIDTTELIA